jgi:uncharacterized protein (TIGR00255 family)
MIRSMTGYGQASADLPQAKVTVTLRSVNHRYADVRLRLPAGIASREAELRRKVLGRIKRGRVEVAIEFEMVGGAETRPQFNRQLLDEVLAGAQTLHEEFHIGGAPDLQTLLVVPGMFKSVVSNQEFAEPEWSALDDTLDQALDALDRERVREGAHLTEEMQQRLETMRSLAAEIERRAALQPSVVRDRLLERLKALGQEVELDPARTAQEAAILADRCDVTEEVVRLKGHLDQALTLISRPDGEPLGKRMDFLLQELNRETNTVNSKSSDLELSRHALSLKAEIEKVREQVQNVE